MARFGFTFKIKPELKDRYKKAHYEIWSEMKKAIKDVGISSYSIFFRKDGTLFAYMETDDYRKSMARLAKMDVSNRWKKHYKEKYFPEEDDSIIEIEIEMLEEVFRLG